MSTFSLGSPLHVGILLGIGLLGVSIGFAVRFRQLPNAILRLLGLLLAVSESIWYAYLASGPWPVWPGMLPLHLCDLTVWLTVYSAVRSSHRTFGIAYFWGLAGTTLALLTPDVQGLTWSYPTVQFFVSHGLVTITLLALSFSRVVPIKRSHWIRAFLLLQLYAAVAGAFNLAFGTNYLYLMSKPIGPTALDLLGPWPWYLLVADILAAGLFYVLSLPLKNQRPVGSVSDEALPRHGPG